VVTVREEVNEEVWISLLGVVEAFSEVRATISTVEVEVVQVEEVGTLKTLEESTISSNSEILEDKEVFKVVVA
jgi:hypothetical protein